MQALGEPTNQNQLLVLDTVLEKHLSPYLNPQQIKDFFGFLNVEIEKCKAAAQKNNVLEYRFSRNTTPKNQKSKTKLLAPNLSGWITMVKRNNEQRIELEIISPKKKMEGKLIGKGKFKDIKASELFIFNLSDSTLIGQTNTVLGIAKKTSEKIESIKSGVKFHKQLETPLLFYPTETPKMHPLVTNGKVQKLEYRQIRYLCDFKKLTTVMRIPISKCETWVINKVGLIEAFIHIAEGLVKLEALEYVHRDAQKVNYLVSKHNPLQPLLNDLDSCSDEGLMNKPENLKHWDLMAKDGFSSTFTDIFTFAYNLGTTFFTNFYNEFLSLSSEFGASTFDDFSKKVLKLKEKILFLF